MIKSLRLWLISEWGTQLSKNSTSVSKPLDVEIKTSFADAIKSDDINETVNYDNIFKLVNSIVSNKRFNLIETLANKIGDQILSKYKIEKVLVRVRKPKAQISGTLDTVEVEIEKSK